MPELPWSKRVRGQLIKRYFITGLLIWVPLGITAWVVSLIAGAADQSLRLLPAAIHPHNLIGFDIPGAGIVVTYASYDERDETLRVDRNRYGPAGRIDRTGPLQLDPVSVTLTDLSLEAIGALQRRDSREAETARAIVSRIRQTCDDVRLGGPDKRRAAATPPQMRRVYDGIP